MSPINTKVVRRSWRLYEQERLSYGPQFLYRNEGMGFLAPRTKLWNLMLSIIAFIISVLSYVIEVSLSSKTVRSFIKKHGPQPGDGPLQAMLEKSKAVIRIVGEVDEPQLKEKKTVIAEVTGGDLGYVGTSEMLVECGLMLAAKKTRVDGGVVTPAYAFGSAIAERFNQYTSVNISVLDGTPSQ
jgi:short subunit dehydrogenase-like uncharacterized protein